MRSSLRIAVTAIVSAVVLRSASAEVVDRIVAIVDRQAITLSEAEQALELRVLSHDAEDLALPQVVERLVEAYLIEREIRRYPAEPVPAEDVQSALESVRRSFPSREAFQMALAANSMTEGGLEELVRRQIAIARHLESRFRSLVYVSEEEIQRYYDQELVPALQAAGESVPARETVAEGIRQILTEREFNRRVDEWIEGLKSRAFVRRYVW